MSTVTSRDGTVIGYERLGDGPPLILVDGAMCYRDFGPAKPLAKLLADSYSVYIYDRRGRGASGNTAPYDTVREVEDLAALLTAIGGTAYVYGISSGAALAADAADRLPGITKLALYEPPFIVDDTHEARPDTYIAEMDALIAADRRSDALKKFMRSVGMPTAALFVMQFTPPWKKLQAVAPTLPNDLRILGDTGRGRPLPTGRWDRVGVPTLVMDGGKSPRYMRNGAKALADLLPNATYRTLPGQNHMVKPEVIAPALAAFFAGADDTSRAAR
jgi:pimeloyl-ACP methyl ester carboxylesterase